MLPHFRPKSFTGNHILVPDDERSVNYFIHPTTLDEQRAPGLSIRKLGHGTVVWRIWPAVLMHTLFAAAVVSFSHQTKYNLGISSVMMTVVGVVIGFVISYRASSGYDRYWQGRCMWSDVVRTSRTFSRLVWVHVPSRLRSGKDHQPDENEVKRAVAEKRAVLKMIEGFAVALKHHLRGEMGIYYADLYPLLGPLYGYKAVNSNTAYQSPTATEFATTSAISSSSNGATLAQRQNQGHVQIIDSRHESTPLLQPSTNPPPESTSEAISVSLIPFNSLVIWLWETISLKALRDQHDTQHDRTDSIAWQQSTPYSHKKHRPIIAGGGENIPADLVRYIGEWVATLEARETVGGSTLGGMMTCLANMEDSLTSLERILTTPLPLVYSAHLSTVWLYLFFLPFQLSEPLGYLAISAVAVAAFLFLGFLAAGEEIEQPFGYDENDLDLDLFIREIVHADIMAIMRLKTPHSLRNAGLEGELGHGIIADACFLDALQSLKPVSDMGVS